jgi:hypothetical protein
MWKQWVNFLLGLVVIIMAYTGGESTLLIVGVLIAVIALWSALGKKA